MSEEPTGQKGTGDSPDDGAATHHQNTVPEAIPANPDNASDGHGKADEQYARKHKRWSLIWTGTTAIAAVLYTVLTSALLTIAFCSFDETRKQVENMDRPWIKLVDLEHPNIRFLGPGMQTQFGFAGEPQQAALGITPKMKNVGKTTAVHIHAWPELVIHKWANGWGEFSKEQKLACANAEYLSGYDATLFHDDSFDAFGTGSQVVLSDENISIDGNTRYVAPLSLGA